MNEIVVSSLLGAIAVISFHKASTFNQPDFVLLHYKFFHFIFPITSAV